MKSRSASDLQAPPVSFDTNFLAASLDLAIDSGNEGSHPQDGQAASLAALPLTNEDGSAAVSEGVPTAAPFALLDTEAGRPVMDPAASIADTNPGSGSLNVIGAPVQETSVSLHIAGPVDSGFTLSGDPLFGAASSASAPIVLASLTPMSFGTFGAAAVAAGGAEPSVGISTSHIGLDINTPAASTAVLAHLENGPAVSPITNAGVGPGGATAAQVQQALDESGLSVNGTGIKVGVLSDSFNELGGAAADEADGVLPSASNIQVLKDLPANSGGSDEGRAMMQIIHDIAPGASLAFYTADEGEQDFANGILALAAAGAKVIVDDVGYFDEPFFQNGVVAQAIQTVEAEGVTYVTAAGNEASNGYQAAWTPISGTFDGVALTDAESFGGSLTQTVTINTEGISGADIPLVLEWNQAYGAATSNLEILVFHNGTLVGTATNQTSGEPSNPWVEIDFRASGTYQVAIENLSGPNPGLIKEITEGDGLPATISGANSGTVVGHSMTPGAITAGAVNAGGTPAFGFTPTSESFSSSGAGAELLFANNGTALSSPDLLSPVAVSGVDGIATTVPGGLSDFFGTSASSASLAGVAALILSADPNLTPAQVEAIMEQTALSMANPAVSGAGLVQVDPAVAAALRLAAPFVITGTASQVLQGGSTVTLLSAAPTINDASSTTLSSATIKIANAGGNAVTGDNLFVNGIENGLLGSGVTASWNATTDTLTLNGTASIAVYETLLSEVSFQDTGTDTSSGSHPVRTVTWTINDGTNSYQATSQVTVERAPVAVNNTATDTVGAIITAPATSGVLSHDTDLDGDHLTVISVSDTAHGAGSVGASLAGTYGHLSLNADGSYSYVADNTAAISGGPTGSHLQDVFTYTVSDGNGGTTNASLTITLDRAPVVAASNITLPTAHAVAASSLFSVTDPDGNAITTYAFMDTGSGHFVLNGVVEPNNQEIDVTAARLSQLTYQGVAGSTADTVEVRVNDGTLWSTWTSFIVTPSLVIETNGVTSLVEVGNNYYLNPVGGGTGPELQSGGAAFTAGQLSAGWVVVGAERTASGYEVALQDAATNQFSIWNTDSSGRFISYNAYSGSSTALEALETSFHQDLNGDGVIGINLPTHVIESLGTTSLVEVGNNYFLDSNSTGTGPELQFGGAAFTAGQLSAGWAIVGAEQTASGYEVALQDAATNQFSIWNTDSSGSFVSYNAYSGSSTALEALETSFHQDLNGDGVIGINLPTTVIESFGSTSLVEVGNNFFLNPVGGGTGPELQFGGAAFTAGQLSAGWVVVGAEQTAGGYEVALQDAATNQFSIWNTDGSGRFVSYNAYSGSSTALEALETSFHQDLNGDGVIGVPAGQTAGANFANTAHQTAFSFAPSDQAFVFRFENGTGSALAADSNKPADFVEISGSQWAIVHHDGQNGYPHISFQPTNDGINASTGSQDDALPSHTHIDHLHLGTFIL
jgi:VCBS repeat-containing protein